MQNIWKDLFEQTGLNITSLSKETFINRSSINQMIKGTRPITDGIFEYVQNLPISDELKNKFSALYLSKESDNDYSSLLFYFFETARKYDSEIVLSIYDFDDTYISNETVINSSNMLLAIYHVLKASAETGKTVLTNIPVSIPGVADVIRSVCQNYKYNKLIHIIPITSEFDFECIDFLWYSLHMAEEGINTFSMINDNCLHSLFPYCITNGDTAVIFDENFTVGYIVKDNIANIYAEKLYEIQKNAKLTGFFIDDDVQALTIENQYFSKSTKLPLFVLDSFLCTNKWTKDQIIEIAQDYLPYNTKNVLAEQFVNYLKSLKPHTSYYTYDAVKSFVETGRVIQISKKYVKEASKEIRKAVLEDFIKDKKVKLIKQDFIQLPECFGIDWTGSVFSIFTGRNYIDGAHYSNRVCIPYNMISGFHDFMGYMIKWINCCGLVDDNKKDFLLKNFIIQLDND